MASYNPPNPYVPGAFNPSQFITPSDNITTKYLDENYLRFPFAQGTENFVSINNQGALNQGGLAEFSSATIPANFLLPPTITNPVPNTSTTPSNAVATIGYVLANEQGGGDLLPLNNLWTGVNNFNPTPLQTYGSSMAEGLTITNNQSNSGTGLGTQLISYTPTGTIGFAIYSLASSSNTLSTSYSLQLKPDGVSSVLQAQGTNGIAELNASGTGGKIILQASTGVKLQITPTIDFNNWGTLSATSSTSGISSSVNITSPSFIISDGVDDNYQLYSQNTGSYGFVIANTSGGLGTLTLSNGSSTLTTLTSTTTGLSINDAVTLPAQTTYNPATTYGNVASTQQFVQLALASQGAGDASLSANQTFTGINTFTQGVNLPAQNYNPALTYGNVSATQEFVQEAVLDGTGTSIISVGVSNITGFSGVSAFTFSQSINTKAQTNNFYMTTYSSNNFTSGSQINFTLTFPSFLYPTGSTPSLLSGSGINVYSPSAGQSFNLQMSFLNNTQIRCISGGTTTTGTSNFQISGQFLISWT